MKLSNHRKKPFSAFFFISKITREHITDFHFIPGKYLIMIAMKSGRPLTPINYNDKKGHPNQHFSLHQGLLRLHVFIIIFSQSLYICGTAGYSLG